MPDLTALRSAALRLLTQGQAKPATTWRLVLTDTESLTGVGLVCTDPAHPGIDDIGCEYDEFGVYDCCPMVIETWHEKVAAYLVALLNGDAEAARPSSGTITINPDPPHVAEAIREVRRAGGLPRTTPPR